ncbi:MAG TPA: hypothetical protein VKB95_03220 [Chitinophagaceae bacterium]|nr:hypothetical protein [Chitinophagaceae bacterium]
MKLIKIISRLFTKRKARSSLFSAALSEAFKEMFTEMGYHFKQHDKK